MSGFEAIGLVLGGLPLIIVIGGYVTVREGFRYRQERFGFIGQVLWAMRFLDTTALQRMHWNFNVWTDEEAIAWKGSQLNNYNATTVAVRRICYSPRLATDSIRQLYLQASCSPRFNFRTCLQYIGLLERCAPQACCLAFSRCSSRLINIGCCLSSTMHCLLGYG